MRLDNENSFFDRIKSLPIEEKIQKEIFETGIMINNKEEFLKRAEIASKAIGVENIERLIGYLTNPMEKASDFKTRFIGMGEYISVIQDSIFEILYYFKNDSIPYLKEMILRSYIPIKIRAMNIICKLASCSIEREDTISFINDNIDDLRYEVIIPSLYFITRIKQSEIILGILDRFFNLYHEEYEEYSDGLYILENIYRYDKKAIGPYIEILKDYALNLTFRDRPNLEGILIKNILGDENDDVNFCFYESIGEINNIRAALFYARIINFDKDIFEKLKKWYTIIKDPTIKNKIEAAIRKYSAHEGA